MRASRVTPLGPITQVWVSRKLYDFFQKSADLSHNIICSFSRRLRSHNIICDLPMTSLVQNNPCANDWMVGYIFSWNRCLLFTTWSATKTAIDGLPSVLLVWYLRTIMYILCSRVIFVSVEEERHAYLGWPRPVVNLPTERRHMPALRAPRRWSITLYL